MNNLICFPLQPSKIAIILNGERESHLILQNHWHSYEHIIVCDGAWNDINTKLAEKEIDKITVLGDGDSIKNSPKNFIKIQDEDSTDFEKAIKWLLKQNDHKKQIHVDVFWANGKSLDHTLGNLAIASQYAQKVTCHFYAEQQYYRFVENDFSIKSDAEKTVSVFPYPEYFVKSSNGFKYPMNDYPMQVNTQQSLRNEISANDAFIAGTGSCFVFIQL